MHSEREEPDESSAPSARTDEDARRAAGDGAAGEALAGEAGETTSVSSIATAMRDESGADAEGASVEVDDNRASEAGPSPTKPRRFFTQIDRPFVFGFLITLGGLLALVLGAAVSNLSTVLIYIALALFLSLGLDPAVRLLERRGLSRALAVVAVVLALILALALVLWIILPIVISQVAIFIADVPRIVDDFLRSDVYRALEAQFGGDFEMFVNDAQTFLTNPSNLASIGGGVMAAGASISSGISGAVVVFVLTLYFVATLPAMKSSWLRLAPARDRGRVGDLVDQITGSVGNYVMGMVVLAFFNAILVLTLFLVLGLPFPPLAATAAFLITLIPLVGSVIFWIAGTILALFSGITEGVIFAVVYLVYMQIEAYVLTPRIMNRAVSVPGSLVVIGALAGGTLLGLLGALIAVPIMASILIMVKQVWMVRQDART